MPQIVRNYVRIVIGYAPRIVIRPSIAVYISFHFEKRKTFARIIDLLLHNVTRYERRTLYKPIVGVTSVYQDFLSRRELLIISFISIRSRRDPLKILTPTSASFNKVYRSYGMPHWMLFPLRQCLLSLSFPTSGN